MVIGLSFAVPQLAAWSMPSGDSQKTPELQAVPLEKQSAGLPETIRVPVEVLARGSKTEWVMVEVQTRPIPEPSALNLLLFSLALCLGRRRSSWA